ncbi:hypothetical protein N657DRAFT_316321 [Parathielavia appendiculata]|uniref:Uncharacterized protein n=1 Tax=Parathielavia appendiculata TaxID=2587402 RepID=A0AAN6YZ93_9PEZI|nr:hypothetical protein N657DRAFT_316321 [Parathielavia appendiculata]
MPSVSSAASLLRQATPLRPLSTSLNSVSASAAFTTTSRKGMFSKDRERRYPTSSLRSPTAGLAMPPRRHAFTGRLNADHSQVHRVQFPGGSERGLCRRQIGHRIWL